MYYDLSNEYSTNMIGLSLGPLYITFEQVCSIKYLFSFNCIYIFKIIIGVIVELFGLIPSILLVQLFRRIRFRENRISSLSKMKVNFQIAKKKKTFPWWFIFIAYGLCIILVSLSIIFIIARGIEFGNLKTQKWLTSILSGFFSSIFLIQPLKVKIDLFSSELNMFIKDFIFGDILCLFLSKFG